MTEMNITTLVKLANLSIDPMNVRKTDRDPEPMFIGSIAANGILHDLIVRPNQGKPGHFLITDGGKRHASLIKLRDGMMMMQDELVTNDTLVRVKIVEQTDEEARKASATSNLIRSDMHPVDEFDAFAAMVLAGMEIEDIAVQYGRESAEIRQSLALSRIAQPIRKAWRDDEITGEQAEAFTQIADHKLQEKAFSKVRKNENFGAQDVLRAIDLTSHELISLYQFVGKEAYLNAGHEVRPTLFTRDFHDEPGTFVSDANALKVMAAEKMQAECEKLVNAGWGWAVTEDEAPKDWRAWRRVAAGDLTKEQKGEAGCVLSLDYSGKLNVEKGVLKPGVKITVKKKDKKKTATAPRAGSEGDAPEISAALGTRLTEQLTIAAAHVLENEPHAVVFDLALATLWGCAGFETGPINIKISGGLGMGEFEDKAPEGFANALDRVAKMTTPQKQKLLASILSASLNLCSHQLELDQDGYENEAALLDSLNEKNLMKALRSQWNSENYFESVSKKLCIEAINEAVGKEHGDRCAGMTKGEVAAFAHANVPKTGWLPKMIRPACYDGPEAKKPKAKKKAN